MPWLIGICIGLFIGFWIYLYKPRVLLMGWINCLMRRLHELFNKLNGRD